MSFFRPSYFTRMSFHHTLTHIRVHKTPRQKQQLALLASVGGTALLALVWMFNFNFILRPAVTPTAQSAALTRVSTTNDTSPASELISLPKMIASESWSLIGYIGAVKQAVMTAIRGGGKTEAVNSNR